MAPAGAGTSNFVYSRFDPAGRLVSEYMVSSDKSPPEVWIFPQPPLLTPKRLADYVYLKFKAPVVVDQKSDSVFYTKTPIEIAVYRRSKDEELLLDAFSLQKQQYALYGSPEKGVLCRYKEVEAHANSESVKPTKYEEALVRVVIRNEIDNVVKISKVVIPMDGVVLDHAHDDCWLSGSVEMNLDQTFGRDVINVRLVDTKVKRPDKTSEAKKTDSIVFLMDGGY